MLQVEFKLKLGQDEFLIKAEVAGEKEFFETMSFYSSLPKTGPNGETDLKLVFRNVKGYTFYSVVSEEAKQEFALGQHKEGGSLYAKSWQPLYQKEGEGDDGPQEDSAPKAKSSGFGKKSAPAPAKVKAAPEAEAEAETPEEVPEEDAQETPPPKAAAPATNRINNLMAKYTNKSKPGATNANLKRE